MKDIKICACGIAAADCDYHKPEPTIFEMDQYDDWLVSPPSDPVWYPETGEAKKLLTFCDRFLHRYYSKKQ